MCRTAPISSCLRSGIEPQISCVVPEYDGIRAERPVIVLAHLTPLQQHPFRRRNPFSQFFERFHHTAPSAPVRDAGERGIHIPIYHAHPTVRDSVLIGAKWIDPAGGEEIIAPSEERVQAVLEAIVLSSQTGWHYGWEIVLKPSRLSGRKHPAGPMARFWCSWHWRWAYAELRSHRIFAIARVRVQN